MSSDSDRHYYIVNKANDNFLAPVISDDKSFGWYGMAESIEIYQYDQNNGRYQDPVYRQSFKWMIQFVSHDGENDVVRFNNKWTGMYLVVKDDSSEEGARLSQAKTGSTNGG